MLADGREVFADLIRHGPEAAVRLSEPRTAFFGAGDGHDTVSDLDATPGRVDEVLFTAGVTPQQVSVERGGVLRMILREGLVMTLAGAALGFLFALSTARLFSGVLYQVSPAAPVAFTLAPVVLVGVALVACWLPARRAAKVDPIVALRNE